MGPQPKALPAYSKATNVKDLLEDIGEEVQKIAHNAALERKGNLHGLLSSVKYTNDIAVDGDRLKACDLNQEYDTNVTGGFGRNYPCANRPDVRFSDIYGGQCTDSKIKGNVGNNGGACAPLRRLFLCDQHLAHMEDDKINNTDNLLLEVSLAAKYEGESIIKDYEHLGHHNSEGICTALARSFADIGDIIRGKDLFIGYNQKDQEEKRKLQENLKKIFKKIQEKLTTTNGAEARYKDGSGNFFKLREDWWNANRKEVWKAITCKAKEADKYFREKTSEGNECTVKRCKCLNGDPPTNLDYVPQYLRWFEEWAEEFCRKKKKYVNIVKKYCRGDEDMGEHKYCSFNGYDCEQTIRKIGLLRMGNNCTKCLVACSHYKNWLANQEREFTKQKEKYTNEINGSNDSEKKENNSINDIYEKDFYKNLKGKYDDVNEFLKLLNQEKECEAITKEEGTIDFTKNGPTETFYRSDYCQVCPECGVKCDGNNCTQRTKNDRECSNKLIYKPQFVELTDINVLCSGDEDHDIIKKLDNFCRESGTTHNEDEKWKCYYMNSDNNMCKIENNKKPTEKLQNSHTHPDIMTYIDFFMFWVNHMLKDSIDWRETINSCMNKARRNKCNSGCNTKCDCFKKWVKKKQVEWKHIKEQYEKQTDLPKDQHFGTLEWFLEQEFLPSIEEAYGNDEAIEKIEELLEEESNKEDSKLKNNKKDIIDFLLEHELEDASTCVKSNEKKVDCTDDDYLDEIHILKLNPCGRSSGGRHDVNVTHIAREMQREAKNQLDKSGSRGSSVLKADASKGEYHQKGLGSELKKGNGICDITKNHSNTQSSSGYTYEQPCKGKDSEEKMFEIENGWLPDDFMSANHKDLYMPPRRRHFCTSNVEHLDANSKGFNGADAIHSLLGYVLLAAKEQADFIKKGYVLEGFKDDSTKCRAMKYSFADLGDIIKGTDLWDEDVGEKKTQENLVKIFKNIKEGLPNDIQGNYKENGDGKHLELRKDWWEANRHQVWRAMKCALKSDNIQCRMTPDDYIPQKLRWMTEWAEWYCKYQAEAYKTLQKGCGDCMSEKCMNGDHKCTTCMSACDAYKKKIEPWRNQWEHLEQEYTLLYAKAKIAAINGGTDNSTATNVDKDKNVIDFLQKLHEANGGKRGPPDDTHRVTHDSARVKRDATVDTTPTVYSTAAGYIHQEAIMNCEKQTQFCKNKNGENSISGTQNNQKYAFKEPPKGYEKACSCEDYYKAADPQDDACTIVEKLLKDKNEISEIDICKKNQDEQWKCGDTSLVKDEGVCMPPRRQKLCLYFLTDLNFQTEKKEDDLRKAFIKCAAAETFLSLQYYNSNNVHDTELLDSVIIPPEFLRSMFYTYADYRDICLGTDISKKSGDVSNAKDNIGKVFEKGKSPGNLSRDQWWKEYGLSIWKGMLCALSYDTKTQKIDQHVHTYLMKYIYKNNDIKNVLEEFASRPPFFRWFIEWSDEFCREQKKKYNELKEKCNKCCNNGNVTSDECKTKCVECQKKCEEYKGFITEWQENWNKQKNKYETLYTQLKITSGSTISSSDSIETKLLEYLKNLKEQNGNSNIYSKAAGYIEKEGYIDDCNVSTQKDFRDNSKDKNDYAFRVYPHKYNTACTCNTDSLPPLPPRPRPGPQPQPPQPDLSPLKTALVTSTLAWSVGIGFAAFTYFYLKKKTKSSVGNLFQILQIPKSDYDIPTKLSPNRYIPYTSGKYRGKRYIYLEGDSGTDSGYTDHYSDITSSSESEYEELDINDIYAPRAPKYKTLIEVVLEPSGNNTTASGKNTPSDTQNDIQNDGIPSDIPNSDTPPPITDDEWNQLKHDFISNMLQNQPKDVPNDYKSGKVPLNTQPNTLYFDNNKEKPFITSIHDRNLYTGEEYSYNVNMVNSMNDIPMSDKNGTYTGIDLINDSLNNDQHVDIYDEVLKRKENELFGTNHTKHTTTNSVAKKTHNDPIVNQINLFHKWLDRHRDMCEQWDNTVDILNKLKELWENETHSGNTHPSDSNKTLNTDVSIQIHMDNPKPINEFTNMDIILEDLDKYNEPYYDVQDDIYYDVNDHDTSTVDSNNMDVPSKVQIEMDVNTKLVKEKYPIGDVWDI